MASSSPAADLAAPAGLAWAPCARAPLRDAGCRPGVLSEAGSLSGPHGCWHSQALQVQDSGRGSYITWGPRGLLPPLSSWVIGLKGWGAPQISPTLNHLQAALIFVVPLVSFPQLEKT